MTLVDNDLGVPVSNVACVKEVYVELFLHSSQFVALLESRRDCFLHFIEGWFVEAAVAVITLSELHLDFKM